MTLQKKKGRISCICDLHENKARRQDDPHIAKSTS